MPIRHFLISQAKPHERATHGVKGLIHRRTGLSRSIAGHRNAWAVALGAMAAILIAGIAKADPRAVIELFTSQGCSSCPEADKLLGELAKDSNVIALSLPIDYWDYLGWKDTLADARFTARQRAYSKMRGDRNVYTPQVIVNGKAHALGSDRVGIERAISETAAQGNVMAVPVLVAVSKGQITITIPAVPNATAPHSEVWITSVARAVPIAIGRGENRGREVTYHNVVRGLLKVGDWNGKAGTWSVPIENISREGVDAAVVYVQEGNRDKPGAMLGAAYATLH